MKLLPLLLLLVIAMGLEGRNALSTLTGLKVQEGSYEYLDGTKEVAIRGKGKDQFDNWYQIRCRWKDGRPIAICIWVKSESI